MKTNQFNKRLLLSGFLLLNVCISSNMLKAQAVMDLVCGKKVNTAESYDYKYKDKLYYFDSYDCRESFKNNPKFFLEKVCVPNENIIDIVCGVKVNIEESFDYKYAKKVHHFHSFACRETFIKDPAKYMKNICAPKDSVK